MTVRCGDKFVVVQAWVEGGRPMLGLSGSMVEEKER